MTMWPVLLILLAMMERPEAANEKETEISDNILNFATVFNGDRDNQAQIDGGLRDRDFIQMRMVPVDVPCLRPKPVVYIEEVINGVVRRMFLGVISEGVEKTIYLTMYNFTDSSSYKYKTYDLANLANVKREDLRREVDCISAWLPIGNNTFIGNFKDCRHSVKGKHQIYCLFYNCEDHVASMPLLAIERTTAVPYRYAVPYSRPNYVSPCEKKDKGIKDSCPPA